MSVGVRALGREAPMLRGLVNVPQPVVKADNETGGRQSARLRGSKSIHVKWGREFQ